MTQPSNTEATSLMQKDDGYGGTSNASSDVEGGHDGGYNKDSPHSAQPSGKSESKNQHWIQNSESNRIESNRISHRD
jgi:hypothetical protein